MILIREANADDVQIASDILNEAAEWLCRRGMPLWRSEMLSVEVLEAYVLKKELFLALVENEPAGTIIVQDEDPLYWPDIVDDRSLYFHKLAVRRKYAGTGVSKALIGHAYEMARQRGKAYLRMDCSARHTRLREFYEINGFKFVDQMQVGDLLVDRLFRAL